MKNENYKYIKYKAYGQLRKLLISRLKCLDIKRPSAGKLDSILGIVYDELKEGIVNPEINPKDDIQTMVDKKREIEDNETYGFMLDEAYEAYRNKFIKLERPTLLQVEKKTQKVLDGVVEDLLLLY